MTEAVAGPSGPGTVILELGAGMGVLVLFTPADMDGREIEISAEGSATGRRTHSRVRPRHIATGTRYAAVYPDLPAGPYLRMGAPGHLIVPADLDLPAVQLGRGEQDQRADVGAQFQDHGSRARWPGH